MLKVLQTNTVRVVGCALAAAVCLGAATANAAIYGVHHNFNMNLGPKDVYRGQWAWYCDALANSKTQGLVHPAANVGSVNFQPPDWDVQWKTAISGNRAYADANSAYDAGANGTGYHQVWGTATLTRPDGIRARAQSRSTLALNLGVRRANGRIQWRPKWSVDSISGTASVGDPLSIEIFDPGDDSLLFDEMLWDLEVNLANGTASWDDAGLVSINGVLGSGTFSVVMDSPHMTGDKGTLSVSWANGLITASDDSGIWDGLLPSVGSIAAFAMQLGDADGFDIGYDFGLGDADFRVQATVGASGAAEEVVPEPCTLAIWSLLGGVGMATGLLRRRKAT